MPSPRGFFRRLTPRLPSIFLLLIAASTTLGLVEIAVRLLDGIPLTVLRVPTAYMLPQTSEKSLLAVAESMPRAEGVDPAWIDVAPPGLANRKPPDPRLLAIRAADGGRTALEADLYRQWNSRYVAEVGCKPGGALWNLPTPLSVFDPSEPNVQPIYRFPPSVTTPLGLVTNRFGWRGPDIPLNKPKQTIRVAFVGASTTVGGHEYPFSYPEFVGHWLNLWAKRDQPHVRFDIINAGREGLVSSSTAAIVRQEIVPAEPDLVVYYEGANQFRFPSLIDVPVEPPKSLVGPPNGIWRSLSGPFRPYSGLVRRLDIARLVWAAGDGTEPAKPDYRFTWPEAVDEMTPDLASAALPLQLPNILKDLDVMRTSLGYIGSELAVSSFVWLVHDGMRLRPHQDRLIFQLLNKGWWPFRYRDMRRMADFQNRVFRRYAATHGLTFVDLAAVVPADPDLFKDAIHFNREGTRVQAWGMLNALLPLIRERIAAGKWPRRDRFPASFHRGIPAARELARCP